MHISSRLAQLVALLETTLYQELLRSMLLHVIESWDLLFSDIMISNLEYEVLISDRLGGELGIVILDLRGKWRFQDEDTVRETEPPEYWF